MKISESWMEFLVYLAPSLLVFGMAYFLVKKFLDTDQKMKFAELKRAMHKDILPLRLQAYERIVLYLERISPNNMLIRVYSPGMTAADFHRELLGAIRSEYEHNLTQQVYVTNQAWEIVRGCRDELIKIINTSFAAVNPQDPGAELSKKVFENLMSQAEHPVHKALDQIKNEAHALF
jgi:hypothetical protein